MSKNSKTRLHGRACNEMRPISLSYNFFEYADGSVLYQLGKTKVACAVTLTQSVPHFLRGKRTGWLTAEYAMLPAATHQRTDRESNSFKRNGRSLEISRLIGRSFRSIVNLDLIGERTIVIDCDVLQADGSTRTACITGAFLALKQAVGLWEERGIIESGFLTDEIAAVSVGYSGNEVLLDIDFNEDKSIDADFNFVCTKNGNIIEIQGSAEKNPMSWDLFDCMKEFAQKGVCDIFNVVNQVSLPMSTGSGQSKQRKVFNQIRINQSSAG